MSSYTTPGANRTTRRRSRRYRPKALGAQLLRGLLVAIGVTLVCVLVFALLMQWLKPSDSAIRIVNQLIKLGAIFVGVKAMLGRNCENGLIHGALLGVCYMALGVGLFALLSVQSLPWTAYLSDLAMGVAGGGICGAIIGGIR
jgi:putative membrane protein (TIGR04086 family)